MAKIDADGTLQAHVEAMDRGDGELYFRYAFRQWPESSGKIWASRCLRSASGWKDQQRASQSARKDGRSFYLGIRLHLKDSSKATSTDS